METEFHTVLTIAILILLTVIVIFVTVFSSQEEHTRRFLLLPLCPKNHEGSCDLCSSDWMAFGNSYYHVLNETKTWKESHTACWELNSHLVTIDTAEELENLSQLQIQGWIILNKNETDALWLWEDGPNMQQPILDPSGKKNHRCPYMIAGHISVDDCSSRKMYICEFP